MEAAKTITNTNRKETRETTHNNANKNLYNEINVLICKPNLLFLFTPSLSVCFAHENECIQYTSCFYIEKNTLKKMKNICVCINVIQLKLLNYY